MCSYNSSQIIKSFLENDFVPEGQPDLSKVEYEIIQCAEKGLSITQSAAYLGRSPNTIAVYRSKIIKKFNCSSINQVCVKLKGKDQDMLR
ncbi:MAG: helix-turn-helix transcriptional regulator [Taibaiella sp.]|nr:helix-turn-helix transcriptional regulator [Taibaiella sp.]